MGVVGLLGVAGVLHVDVGPSPRERVGVIVRQRIALPPASIFAFVEPVSLTGPVERGGDHVSRVPDQEYQAALGEGFNEQRCPDRAVRLLDHEVMVGAEAGSCVFRAVEHEVPYGVDPTPARRVGHNEVWPDQVRILCPAVKVAEELADHGLLPDQMPARFSHHAPEPRASTAPRAEDPDDVLGPYTGGRSATKPPPQPRNPQGDLPVLAGQPAAAPAQRAARILERLRDPGPQPYQP